MKCIRFINCKIARALSTGYLNLSFLSLKLILFLQYFEKINKTTLFKTAYISLSKLAKIDIPTFT